MDNNKKIWGLGDFRKNNYKYFFNIYAYFCNKQ